MCALNAIAGDAPDVAMIVAAGSIVTTADGEPALLADGNWTESAMSTEGVIPLAMLRNVQRATHAVIVVAGWPVDTPARDVSVQWLDLVATRRPTDLVAVGADATALATIDSLLTGLAGTAVDPATGTITLRSLGEHLARGVPALAVATASRSTTIASPSPLNGPWDPRLSRRSRSTLDDPPIADVTTEDLTGTVLPGRLRLDARLARGGFGTVYRAKQLAVARDVAVKVLHGNVDAGSASGRLFVHEIQSVGRIEHPNVVRIYHADITPEGRLFFAMELLDGRDLEQVISVEGRLPRERALALVSQLLDGLGAAHEVDLVHADIKPANILIVPTRNGERVVLVDFGLARLRMTEAPSLAVGGTPAYMAPEQLCNGRVDARSDLFSAALVLVTLLTGWRRRTKDELTPPLHDIEDPYLRKTLQRALAIDPADRYQSATELAAALTGAPSPTRTRVAPRGSQDGERLFGRTRELDELLEGALYRRATVLVGRPGIGKTALVRAGLIPRLEAMGVRVVYQTGGPAAGASIAHAIDPDASDLSDALVRWQARDEGRLIVIVDQLEAMPSSGRASDTWLFDIVDPKQPLAEVDVAVVVCVSDDAIPSHDTVELGASAQIVRLGALDVDGAREAIVLSLQERRIDIDAALVETLIVDLRAAAAALGGEPRLDGCYPPHLGRVRDQLVARLGPGEVRVSHAHYERIGGSVAMSGPIASTLRARRPGIVMVATGLAALAVVAVAALSLRDRTVHGAPGARTNGVSPAPASSTTVTPRFPERPTVVVGGSGTLLWGFFAPLASFLEVNGELIIPITSQNDVGSGGALQALRSGRFDVALLSRRAAPDTLSAERSSGKVLVEVAIGFDETSLFVWHDNPVRRIDIAAIRAHLCCRDGTNPRSLSWSDFGATDPALAAQPVTWFAFGRQPGSRRETTSATLALADEWLCAPERLCPSRIEGDAQANEVLSLFVRDTHALALSSRSFATDQVAAVRIVDRVRGTRLDGRKAFWAYALVDAASPIPTKLCRFFSVALDASVAGRLAAIGKAIGLTDESRQQQRAALGLDNGTCGTVASGELVARQGDGDRNRINSPIAKDVEIETRWISDSDP